ETVIKNKNNKEALTKLEDIQKELDDLSKQKNQSDELLASLKAEAVLKQQELTNSEKKNNSITNEISAIKTETASLEKDLANENDKSIKENILAQIRELNNEIGLKEKELLTNNQKIETLKNEVDGVNQEIQIASKILNGKTDDIATNEPSNNESSSSANNTSGSDTEKNPTASLSYAELKNKYDPSLNSNTINKTNKEEVAQQNDILKTYNQEVNSLISLNKNTLAKTSNPTEKKKLNEEIKNLEKLKTENENLIASNNLIIKQQENSSVANNETNPNETTSLESITNKYNSQIKTVNADNASREEITQQIDILKAYNQEIDALIEANKNALTKTTKVPDQEKLNEEIKTLENQKIDNDNLITANVNSIKQIENNTQISNNVNANGSNTNSVVLTNEAETLNNQAYELRKEAANKTGEEKEAILRQAIEKENLSIEKKLTASVIAQKQNQAVFDNNTTNLTELQKLTGEKTSDEISQANMLADEAALNFKQAQKMRTEAEAYPSGSAKLGGLSNAEEKENEAIAKQKAALAILSKNNPGYKMKPLTNSDQNLSSTSNTNTQSNQVKEQIKSYTELSKGNQEDIKSASDIVSKNPAFNDPSNKQAQDLKLKADQLSNEAQTLINQAETTNTDEEKARILTQANAKEREALKALSEANEVLKNNNNNSSIVTNNEANNSTPENNISTENNNANNTARVNNNNSTENQNESSSVSTNSVTPTNTVATNTNNETVNNEDSNPVNNPNTDNNNSSNNQKDGNIGAEVSQLKSGLNNPNESALVNFNNYNSTEAINLKNKATEKINTALKEDKQISSDLDNVSQLAVNNSGGSVISKQTITALISEADQLNDQAFALRKASATKTADEKEKDINNAKTLEANAISKKIEAASKQQQLNNATYDANKQSLEELTQLAKGKNIAELNNAETLSNEADLFLKQAGKLREEANAYPSDGAKLGGYSNAEEKEAQAIEKQQALLDIYKKHFPDYVPKKAAITDDNPEALSKLNNTKANLNTNNQTHIEGLQLLSQANEIEYKNRFAGLSENLNSTQIDLKTKAQNSYKNNEDLINQANQSSDLVTKKNLLVEANKSGQEAINLLNQISNPESVVANNSGNNINNSTPTATNTVNQTANKNGNAANNSNATNNTATNNTNSQKTNNNNTTTNNVNVVKIKVEGLEVKNTNAYSADRPIPLDEKIQDGLVFKVQIGAFKTVLPNNTFKGLSPVIAQTTPNGYIRYMAGNFEQYSSANAVKNDLRNLGYSDAFVVAYYNGVRISLNEATDKAKAAGQTIDPTTNTSAGITANTNVPRNVITPSATSNNSNDTQPAEIANELEKMNGLLYTVQIGVYSKQVTKSQLSNLRPIYTEQLPNGLYRYTAGIYNQTDKLIEDKRKVVELGVKDAFISSYYNAKRIPFAEGKKLQAENNNLKMEAQNPIIFSGELATTNNTGSNTTATNTITTTPIANAFSNGVTSGPAPTPENGVKTDESGISYKVQIGAYKNQVPNDVASKFLNIKTWPVQNVVINGLFIYTIGNFTSATFAKKLKDEAISLGITDAYITVYKDGKKLYGAEATTYLNN
ncbi:MAG: hypothetical protein JNM51_05325, partial [Bacteroidia bacterium]|nr:hypothetical protein [Bacteroidia bacterium]